MPALALLALLLGAALHDDADYRAAAERYRELDYEQALFAFERLSTRADLTPAEKAEVLLWMALCHDGVGNALAADRMMNEALARDRAAQFPVKTSPDVAARLEAARAALPDDPTPTPDRPPPVAKPPEASAPVPWLALASTGGAAVALVGAGALGVVSGLQWGAANDSTRFADERSQAHQVYTGTLVGAVALGVVGAALGGVAGYLWVTRSEP